MSVRLAISKRSAAPSGRASQAQTAPNRNRYLLFLEEQTLSLLSSLKLLGLSPRETEVLYWLIRGKDNRAIAKNLNVHISTVRKHLENIFYKLGVQSRTEAIAKALEKLGILIDRQLTINH